MGIDLHSIGFIVLFANLFDLIGAQNSQKWDCKNKVDQALVRFNVVSNKQDSLWNNAPSVEIYHQKKECINCNLIRVAKLDNSRNYTAEVVIDSFYAYKFKVYYSSNVICDTFQYDKFQECAIYSFDINLLNQTCKINVITESLSLNCNYYLYIGLLIAILVIVLINVFIKFYPMIKNIIKKKKLNNVDSNPSTTVPLLVGQNHESIDQPKPQKPLRSLDTFRGLSVLLILFVSYGAGGYKQLHNKPWHGMSFGSFLFPWFLWTVGFAIPISLGKLIEKEKLKRRKIIFKIVATFLKKFVIGVLLCSIGGAFIEEFRIMGILQRVALTYLIVASIELLLYKRIEPKERNAFRFKPLYYFQDIIHAWKQWIFILMITTLWLLLTFLVKQPECPRGYFGPGGLHESSKYSKCTGGAAGFIDRLILRSEHMPKLAELKEVYYADQAFEPEGILSTLTACLTVFLGVIAGRIYLFYHSHRERIMLWSVWAFITFALFGILSFFDFYNGPIPVNAHLWTLTYVLLVGCTSFILFMIFYVFIDMLDYWDGAPLRYIGINPILIYVFCVLFIKAFPIQWKGSNTHLFILIRHFWGCLFWTLFACYLYHENMILIL